VIQHAEVFDVADAKTDEFLDRHYPGHSRAVQALKSNLFDLNRWQRLAPGKVHCVLITGETGVGKYRLAKLLVQHTEWTRQPGYVLSPEALGAATANLVRVLLTAVPDTLAESELFGHVKGAFTGAHKDKPGFFGSENVQNVLLDEIGDASLALQGKLLEVIEDGTFRRVGDDPSVFNKTQARILVATRENLEELVAEKKFREDLYWRVIPFRLHLPPLRERAEEIPELLIRMIDEHVNDLPLTALDLPEKPLLTNSDIEFAQGYAWPGNLRQMSDALLSWLIGGCRGRFEDIVTCIPPPGRGNSRGIAAELRSRLRAVLSGERQGYQTVGELWQELVRDGKQCLYRSYKQKEFTAEELQLLFTGQAIKNIRSELSGYRPLAEE
jgi:DNA-binding NtrC family response regulator